MPGSRVWRYRYRDTHPSWWRYLLPWRGGDEWGRRTWVIPVHPFGWLVWAWRTCHCEDCTAVREQTARWEAEEVTDRV